MGERGRLLVMMVAVPLVAFAVASGLLWKWERDWQEGLAKRPHIHEGLQDSRVSRVVK